MGAFTEADRGLPAAKVDRKKFNEFRLLILLIIYIYSPRKMDIAMIHPVAARFSRIAWLAPSIEGAG